VNTQAAENCLGVHHEQKKMHLFNQKALSYLLIQEEKILLDSLWLYGYIAI
jgi:hypothetical protein